MKCLACSIEAEIGTEEEPHPVPERFHTCTAKPSTTCEEQSSCDGCGWPLDDCICELPSAEPVVAEQVCTSAEVVEAAKRVVADWKSGTFHGDGRSHNSDSLLALQSVLRTATLRSEAEVRADERERCEFTISSRADCLKDQTTSYCKGWRDAVKELQKGAFRAKGDRHEQLLQPGRDGRQGDG